MYAYLYVLDITLTDKQIMLHCSRHCNAPQNGCRVETNQSWPVTRVRLNACNTQEATWDVGTQVKETHTQSFFFLPPSFSSQYHSDLEICLHMLHTTSNNNNKKDGMHTIPCWWKCKNFSKTLTKKLKVKIQKMKKADDFYPPIKNQTKRSFCFSFPNFLIGLFRP